MADLRDKIHGGAVVMSNDNAVFLAYHENTPWAHAKIAAGLRLTPESLVYMEKELERRKLALEFYNQQLATESKIHAEAQHETSPVPPSADGQRGPGSDGIRGAEHDKAGDSSTG